MAVILVDFDGTCIPALPELGYSDLDTGASRVLKLLSRAGHTLVLWTARNNSINNRWNYLRGQLRAERSLDEAVRWFHEHGVTLDGINEVPGEESRIGTSRKTLGDYLIDDTAVGAPLTYVTISFYSAVEQRHRVIDTYHIDWKKVEEFFKERGLL